MATTEVALPGPDEMLKRLRIVSEDEKYRDHFYPRLLVHAGETKGIKALAKMIADCMSEYLKQQNLDGDARVVFYGEAPDIVDAIVDDPDLAAMVKERLERVLSIATH